MTRLSVKGSRSAALCAVVATAAAATGPASTVPLAVRLPEALSAEALATIRKLEAVTLRELGEDVVQHRTFGAGGGFQTVLFMHHFLDSAAPELRSKMVELARQADGEAGWGLTAGAALRNRCAELILYKGAEQPSTGSRDKIGWHTDGVTLVTLAAMLSEEGSYQGGTIRLRRPGQAGFENHTLRAGDALAWRGWTEHDVQPVWAGDREVFVTEWWLGPDAAESQRPRLGDIPELTRKVVAADPLDPMAHYMHGRALCKVLPCDNGTVADEARVSLLRSAQMQPGEERTLRALGQFLLGGSWADWLQGVGYLHDICLAQVAKGSSDLLTTDMLGRSWLRILGACACWPAAVEAAASSWFLRQYKKLRPDEGEEEEDEALARAGRQLKNMLYVVVALLVIAALILILERVDRKTSAQWPSPRGDGSSEIADKKGDKAADDGGEQPAVKKVEKEVKRD